MEIIILLGIIGILFFIGWLLAEIRDEIKEIKKHLNINE